MVRLPRGNMAVVSSLIRNFLVNRLDAHPELCEVTNDEIQELRAKSYNATLIRRIDIPATWLDFRFGRMAGWPRLSLGNTWRWAWDTGSQEFSRRRPRRWMRRS